MILLLAANCCVYFTLLWALLCIFVIIVYLLFLIQIMDVIRYDVYLYLKYLILDVLHPFCNPTKVIVILA